MVDALQLRHLRWTVRDPFDAEATPARPQNNCFSRIINHDDSRVITLSLDLEDTVLEVFVVDRSVIKQSDVGARGL